MEPLTLHSIHQQRRASFSQVHGRELVKEYDSPRDEYTAARLAASLFDLSYRPILRLTGPDRASFLHGMVTNDIKRLADGETAYAALLTAKGAMISDARILRRAEDLLLDVEPGYAQAVQSSLQKYIISEDVEVSDVSTELALLRVAGPKAEAILAAAWGSDIALPAGGARRIEGAGEIWLMRSPPWGERCIDVLVSRGQLAPVYELMLQRGEPLGLKPAGFETLEILRVEEGIARFGQDMDEHTIPLEANLEAAINYDKGCYIGQEVIARATFRGHVNKKLTGLVLGGELPGPRASLRRGEKMVGWISSAVRSPAMGTAIALGYVQRDCVEPGTHLEVEGYPSGAVTHALPFVKS